MVPTGRQAREAAMRKAVLRGDSQAFEALCRPLLGSVHAFARARLGGHPDLVEEVVQDTWVVAVRRIRDFDPARGAFEFWVRGIALRVLQNALRRSRRELPRAEQVDPQDRPAGEQAAPDEELRLALTALPEQYQSVLRARYHKGHSIREIAALLARSEKAVESLLGRARSALKQAFQDRAGQDWRTER